MTLHIGVDAWNLPGDHRGIGRYVRALLRCWAGYGRDNVAVTLIIPEWPPLLHAARYRQELDGLPFPAVHRGAIALKSFDLIWFPWNGLSWIPPGVSVATLHDASLFALPPDDRELREREQRPFRVAAATATQVITDSHFSKAELVRHLTIEPDRIDVVHLGVDAVRLAPESTPIREPYVLFVGEDEPRKGLDVLVNALTRLPEPPLLVVAGKRTPDDSLSEVVPFRGSEARSETADKPEGELRFGRARIKYLGHVTDSVLSSLYANARTLVYPSTYEGFGLPVLEAMAYGAPVIASDAAGIPEAGGDAALYFPSGDAEALANAVALVMSEEELADNLRELGKRRAAQMSWDVTASQTIGVFERVLLAKKRREGATPDSSEAQPHLVHS